MEVPLLVRFAVCCAGLAVSSIAQADWYVTAGAGVGRYSGMEQSGWNTDTVCYPTDACFDLEPVPSVPGYRWRYAIDADPGASFSIALGRTLGGVRIEVSAAHSRNDVEQEFVSIEYLDGSARVPREGPVVAQVTSSIGDLTVQVVSLDVYRDLAPPDSRVTPYVGAGLGAAFTKVGDVHFSADYRDTSPTPQAYDPPLSFYGGTQNVDHSDIVVAGQIHAGVDYAMGRNVLIGAKLTCALVDGTEDTGVYSRHPMHAQDPGFRNRNTFDATRTCSISVALKRRLGR